MKNLRLSIVSAIFVHILLMNNTFARANYIHLGFNEIRSGYLKPIEKLGDDHTSRVIAGSKVDLLLWDSAYDPAGFCLPLSRKCLANGIQVYYRTNSLHTFKIVSYNSIKRIDANPDGNITYVRSLPIQIPRNAKILEVYISFIETVAIFNGMDGAGYPTYKHGRGLGQQYMSNHGRNYILEF